MKNYKILSLFEFTKYIIIFFLISFSYLLGFIYPNLDDYMLGYQNYSNQNYSNAIFYFEQALKKDSNNYEILNALANAYQKKTDFNKANDYYTQAISKISPKEKNAYKLYYNQGNNFYKMEKYLEAIKLYKKALDLEEHDIPTKKNLELSIRKLIKQNSKENKKQQQSKKNNEKQNMNPSTNSNPQNNHNKTENNLEQKNNSNNQFTNSNDEKKESQSQSKNNESQEGKIQKLSLKRVEEILKAFAEKELKIKGFEFYKQEKSKENNGKNW